MTLDTQTAANEVYKLPPKLFDARCKACWFVAVVLLLVGLSFWTLDLQWAQFLSAQAFSKMGKFLGELLPPETSPVFLKKLLAATLETLAMSALGTLLAVLLGLALALPASKTYDGDPARWRSLTRLLLNALRSVPELIWATLLLIAALFQVSDGLQVVGLGALRGLGDVKVPSVVALLAYWAVALPLSYWLGFGLHYGAPGVWTGLLAGLSIVAVVLLLRFRRETSPGFVLPVLAADVLLPQ